MPRSRIFLLLALTALAQARTATSQDRFGTVSGELIIAKIDATRPSRLQRHVLVYLLPVAGQVSNATIAPQATVDLHRLQLSPAVIAATSGGKIRLRNTDPISHDLFGEDAACRVDKRLIAGGHTLLTCGKPGKATIVSRRHPQSVLRVIVVPTPYHASCHLQPSTTRGSTTYRCRFELPRVAPGDYVLHTWHNRHKQLRRPVTVRAGHTTSLGLRLGAPRSKTKPSTHLTATPAASSKQTHKHLSKDRLNAVRQTTKTTRPQPTPLRGVR